MQSNKNQAIVACAGGGKTTLLVDKALASRGRVLLTTYTNENVEQIRQYITAKAGAIPPAISIGPWSTFLLREGVRPYQNFLSTVGRVRSIFYPEKKNIYQRKSNYFTPDGDIYGDKLSEFVFECNRASSGKVVGRLERIYDEIFIDELQDLSGWDLEVLKDLLRSKISVTIVGDPRQATFSTNRAAKNKRYKRVGVFDWVEERKKAKELDVQYSTTSHRCNQAILQAADALFPSLPGTTSANAATTGHDGVFAITPSQVADYVKHYSPVVLRHNIRTNTLSIPAINIGGSKGRTFDRVLIFPTKPMLAFLESGDPDKAGDRCKLYVAMTRARFSVAFVADKSLGLNWLMSIGGIRPAQ